MLPPLTEVGGRSSALPSFCFIMPYHIMENWGGGAEVQSWLLARELARRGFRTEYIAQSIRGKRGCEMVENVTIRWVRHARRFRWANALSYYRALSRADADIVVQRMTAFTTGVAALWCRQNRRKFIWICTDNAAPRRWHFLRQQRTANRLARPGLPKRLVFLFNALITDFARHWGTQHLWLAFTQNETQRALFKREFGLESKRMISGHPKSAGPISIEKRLARPVILWMGNLGANKQPEKFIELARLAKETNFSFVMAGGHADAALIAKLFVSAPQNLEWIGHIAFEASLTQFDHATFFINTSIAEGFPNTFIQAWLRGVPVFSLGVDPDGIILRNGLGSVSHDLADLLTQMLALTQDAPRYRALSAAVQRFAETHFRVETMCDHFLANLPVLLRNNANAAKR